MNTKTLLFLSFFFGLLTHSNAQVTNPYITDGIYTLEGSSSTAHQKVSIQKEKSKQTNRNGYATEVIEEVFYTAGNKINGIVYTTQNHQISSVGQVKNGKKHGVWAFSHTDKTNEEDFGHIFEIVYFENNIRLYTHNDLYSNNGAFELNGKSMESSELTDINGLSFDNDDCDYFSGIYKNGYAYSGPYFFNWSGALSSTAVLLDGFEDGLSIITNEGSYISSFGNTLHGNKEGLWIENQYTGEPHLIGLYKNNQKNGTFIFFHEFRQVGQATFKNDELIHCSGTCE